MPKLGVNIDHVATLRQARGGKEPSPAQAAILCEQAGADSIVCHLREDRRHINDNDLREIKKAVRTRLNLEMSLNPGIIRIALKIRPDEATLVPERREEVTTEGGLNVQKYFRRIQETTQRFQSKGIQVNLFIDPVHRQIDYAKKAGAAMIELHTGRYSLAKTTTSCNREIKKIEDAVRYARSLGLIVNAGHGLKYDNILSIAKIPGINELNIGHSIISNSIYWGIAQAVKKMKKLARG